MAITVLELGHNLQAGLEIPNHDVHYIERSNAESATLTAMLANLVMKPANKGVALINCCHENFVKCVGLFLQWSACFLIPYCSLWKLHGPLLHRSPLI